MILMALIVTVVLLRVSHTSWERFGSIWTEAEEQVGTGGQRIAAWKTAIRMMKANPVLGVGPGEFPQNFVKYSDYEEKVRVGGIIGETTMNTHNMILQIGAENGFSGLVIFLLIIILCFRDAIKALRLCRGNPELAELELMIKAVGVSIIGFVVAGLFGNAGYDLVFYTLVSLSVISRKVTEKAKEEDKEDKKDIEKQMDIPIIFDRYSWAFRTLLFMVFAYICLPI
jgi:O-antigen ligase